jgi:hypothetical protein
LTAVEELLDSLRFLFLSVSAFLAFLPTSPAADTFSSRFNAILA